MSLNISTALSHSVNSSGRMGLFVDSATCSCSGCSTYRAQTLDIPLWDAADAHLFAAPGFGPQATLPTLSSTTLEDMYREMRAGPAPAPAPAPLPVRSNGGGITDGSALVLSMGGAGVSVTRAEDAPPVALSRTVTGLGYEPSSATQDSEGEDAAPAPSVVAPPHRRELDHVDELMDGLRGLRAELQIQQDHVYDEGLARSHDEMAAQDAEWDELDRKIDAIEQVMLSFGAIFRTR